MAAVPAEEEGENGGSHRREGFREGLLKGLKPFCSWIHSFCYLSLNPFIFHIINSRAQLYIIMRLHLPVTSLELNSKMINVNHI